MLQDCLTLSLQLKNQSVIFCQSPLFSAATSQNPAAVAHHATSRTYRKWQTTPKEVTHSS